MNIFEYAILKKMSGGGGSSAKFKAMVDGSITEVTAEDLQGLTKLRAYAFAGSYLERITLPDSITAISNTCFAYSQLQSIDLGDSIKTIGTSAFSGCAKLAEVSIGKGITKMDNACFQNCSALKTLTCNATTPPTLGTNALLSVPADCMIYVPEASVSAYKTATNWATRANYIVPIGYVAPEMVTITVKTTEAIFSDGVYEVHTAPKGMNMYEYSKSPYVATNPVDEPFYTCESESSAVLGDCGYSSLYTDSTFTTPVTGSFPLNGDVEIWIKW